VAVNEKLLPTLPHTGKIGIASKHWCLLLKLLKLAAISTNLDYKECNTVLGSVPKILQNPATKVSAMLYVVS